MYRVLLVDDETLIREAISENTKWNELGFELAGACKNGKEAKVFLENNKVDLLLTDICMPFCDGIELSKFVYENYKAIKIVIISGYDEFEYAKQAVKYQVVEYILKPITAQELSETLTKIKEKLDEENAKIQNVEKIRRAYIRNLPLLRGRFLDSFLSKEISNDIFEEKIGDYGVKLSGTQFASAIIAEDSLAPFLGQGDDIKPNLAYFAIFNIADEIMQNRNAGIAFQSADERTVLIFCGDKDLEKRALQICEEIQVAIRKFSMMECTIAVGRMVRNLQQLPLSYTDTKQKLEYKFLVGGNQIIYAGTVQNKEKQAGLDVNKHTDKILLAIKTNSEIDIKSSVEEFIQAIREAYVSKNRSIFYIQNSILKIMNTMDESISEEREIYQREKELINDIYKHEHLSELGKDLVSFCQQISDSIREQKESYCKKQAILALDYIGKNYGDPNISLKTVCSYLAMSTSYFSSIFKSYTGETFIEALTNKRIERAKALFEHTSKKTYEIANMVGYSDPHYFSITFKKVTDMTPTEYAKRVR